jgi:hypothetical protein
MTIEDTVLRLEEIQKMPAGPERDAAQNAAEKEMGRSGISTPDVNACLKLRGMDPDIAAGKVELWAACLTWGREAP